MANEPSTIVLDPNEPTNAEGLEFVSRLCDVMADVPPALLPSILMSFIMTACGNSRDPAYAWNYLKHLVDQNMPKIIAKVGEKAKSKMN